MENEKDTSWVLGEREWSLGGGVLLQFAVTCRTQTRSRARLRRLMGLRPKTVRLTAFDQPDSHLFNQDCENSVVCPVVGKVGIEREVNARASNDCRDHLER